MAADLASQGPRADDVGENVEPLPAAGWRRSPPTDQPVSYYSKLALEQRDERN